jgi:signal transduction histidine kinase
MARRIRHIWQRFALLLTAAAVAPLLAYGVVSLMSLERGTRQTVVQGNLNVATRAAEEITRYISTNADLLTVLSANLQNTGLSPLQQDRILKNYVLQVHEFREISLFDEQGTVVATSRVGKPRVAPLGTGHLVLNGVSMSPIRVDEDLLPTTTFTIHLTHFNQASGWLVGEFSLEELWRMVDRIRVGTTGYALVVAPDGELIAHGDPDKKALVALATNMNTHPLVASLRASTADERVTLDYPDTNGRSNLGVATRIGSLGWTVIVEQPTREAYATATQLRAQLIAAISMALLAMATVGYFFGRSFISPILELKTATEHVAAGRLDTRVNIDTGDEFADLGDAFNTMADRLVSLQDDVKRQERQAMFGRIAVGLVHDLSHPVQNIGNSARLLARDDNDAESREMFRRTVDRELETLKRFMDDLRNLVRPKPLEHFPVDANRLAAEAVESMRPEGDRQGIAVDAHYSPGPLVIDADPFALGRVFRNLITNGIQATKAGGTVTIGTSEQVGQVEITIRDTGAGIPSTRLAAIFDDFVTTKRRGLGLGLAISKRIVEQLDGSIAVSSEVGVGTQFTLRFPKSKDASDTSSERLHA